MFERVDRQCDEDVILVSGWGFDRHIFDRLDLPYNYLFYGGPSVADFGADLQRWLDQEGVRRCSILGWSIGAFAASAFAERSAHTVRHLVLLGARLAYTPLALTQIKSGLQRNKRAALLRLYRASFRGHDPAHYQWFKETLMEDTIERMSVEGLCADLDWLSRARIEGHRLAGVARVTVIHGVQDEVAPAEEARALAQSCPQARCLLLEPCGHLPFLHADFGRCMQ